MIEYQKVKEHDNLYRDASSKAVLNTDREKYAQYINHKNQRQRISELSSFQTEVREDINTLKDQMSQLQELILKSLENKT